jgi:hypothetical protein
MLGAFPKPTSAGICIVTMCWSSKINFLDILGVFTGKISVKCTLLTNFSATISYTEVDLNVYTSSRSNPFKGFFLSPHKGN